MPVFPPAAVSFPVMVISPAALVIVPVRLTTVVAVVPVPLMITPFADEMAAVTVIGAPVVEVPTKVTEPAVEVIGDDI